MKCIVIDDEPKAIDVLKRYIDQVPFLQFEGSFRDGLVALDYLQHHQVDLMFLDINMPKLGGVDLLKSLDRRPYVIFTTAYSEYALTGYEFNLIDYLLKPIELDRFLKAANRANKIYLLERDSTDGISVQQRDQDFVLLKSGPQTYKVFTNDILFLKKDSNYIEVVTEHKTILVRLNMNQVFDIVPQHLFVRVHKSYVVPLAHIEVVEVDQVTVKGHPIPIGKTYRKTLMQALANGSIQHE